MLKMKLEKPSYLEDEEDVKEVEKLTDGLDGDADPDLERDVDAQDELEVNTKKEVTD